jgi:hypothetical protein
MIVKSTLLFLGIIDFFLDFYEKTKSIFVRVRKKKEIKNTPVEQVRPSYL